LLLALLREVGRSPLWAATYWLNPLVMKEVVNSGHMEAVLLPFVLAALLFSIRQRHLLAITMVGLGSGTKVWPVILAPLVLRPLLWRPPVLAGAIALLCALLGAMAWFPYQAGINETSGIVAYASRWQTNSALFPAVEQILQRALGALSLDVEWAGRLTRALFAAIIAGVALALAWRPLRDGQDTMQRATLIVAAMVLLSPAQFPWYLLWVQPLLAFRPIQGLWAATVLTPIYYASFYFHASDTYWIFRDYIVWAIWIPIFGLLAAEAFNALPEHHGLRRKKATADQR
jgi:alpha-1,6-mannosyltransferase